MRNGLNQMFKTLKLSTLVLKNIALGGAISMCVLSWSAPAFGYNNAEEKLSQAGYEAMEKGDFRKAETLLLQGEALGTKNGYRHYPNSLDNLAKLYTQMGNTAKADEYHRKAIQSYSKEFNNGRPASFNMYSDYANLYLAKGDAKSMARAEEILKDAIGDWNHEVKVTSPSTGPSLDLADQLSTMTFWYLKNNEPEKGLEAAKMAVRIGENMDSVKYYPLLRSDYFHLLAKAQIANKQLADADNSLKKAISMRNVVFNDKDFEIAELMNTKYDLLVAQGKAKEAKAIEQSVFSMWPRVTFTSEKWNKLIKGASPLAENSGRSGPDEDECAVAAVTEAAALAKSAKPGAQDIRHAESLARLAINLLRHHHYEKSAPEIRKAVADLKLTLGAQNPHNADFLELWGGKLGKYPNTSSQDAIYVYREALAMREANLATQKKQAFESAKLITGFARDLYANHRRDEAQALLERATQLLVKSGGLANNTVTDALADLIQLTESPFAGNDKKTKVLYEQLLAGEKDLLGPTDPDVKLYAKRYAALLRRSGQAADAARVEQQYSIKASN